MDTSPVLKSVELEEFGSGVKSPQGDRNENVSKSASSLYDNTKQSVEEKVEFKRQNVHCDYGEKDMSAKPAKNSKAKICNDAKQNAEHRDEKHLSSGSERTSNSRKRQGSPIKGSKNLSTAKRSSHKSVDRLSESKSNLQDSNHHSVERETSDKHGWFAESSGESRSRGRYEFVKSRSRNDDRWPVYDDRNYRSTSMDYNERRSNFNERSMHGSNARQRWPRYRQNSRDFDSFRDEQYADFEHGQQRFMNDCFDTADDNQRWFDRSRCRDLRGRPNRSRRTFDDEEYNDAQNWRYGECDNRFVDDDNRQWESTDVDSYFYDRNSPRSSPGYNTVTGRRRHRWNDNSDLPLRVRQPVRNRLGYRKPAFDEPEEYVEDGRISDYSNIEQFDYNRNRNRNGNFKSSANFRPQRGNNKWRGRKAGYCNTKRTDSDGFQKFNADYDMSGHKKSRSNNVNASDNENKLSEPDVEGMVGKALSTFRRRPCTGFSETDSSDDSPAKKTMKDAVSKRWSRNGSEEHDSSRSKSNVKTKLKPFGENSNSDEKFKGKNMSAVRSLSPNKEVLFKSVDPNSKETGSKAAEGVIIVHSDDESKLSDAAAAVNEMARSISVELKQREIRASNSSYSETSTDGDSSCDSPCRQGPRTPCDEAYSPTALSTDSAETEKRTSATVDSNVRVADNSSHIQTVANSVQAAWPVYPPLPVINNYTVTVASVPSETVTPSLCTSVQAPWTVQQQSTMKFESKQDEIGWNLTSAVPPPPQAVPPPPHGLLPTVFRSDWPTAADQQMPLLPNCSSLQLAGSFPTASTNVTPCGIPPVAVGNTNQYNQQPLYDPACQQQQLYSTGAVYGAPIVPIQSFFNKNPIDSTLAYSETSVYGDSPLLDEPVYNNSPAAVTSTVRESVFVDCNRSTGAIQGNAGSAGSNDNVCRNRALSMGSDDNSSLVRTNRQQQLKMERIADEVSNALKPFYLGGTIDKEEYKDIMRKAVPKIHASRHADIDTKRINLFVVEYVNKVKLAQKRVVADKMQVVQSTL